MPKKDNISKLIMILLTVALLLINALLLPPANEENKLTQLFNRIFVSR